MKNNLPKIITWSILILCIALIIPSLINRTTNEDKNKNVVVSLLYNDIRENITSDELENQLEKYKEIGVDNISVMEEDINGLVSAGEVTCIKYNVLLHKYDDESMIFGDILRENCPDITLDSYIVLVKRPDVQEKLRYHLPRRYSDKDYMYVGNFENTYENTGKYSSTDLYVFYDGYKQLWDFAVGYNVNDIRALHDKGFGISLIHKVKNYDNTLYLDDMQQIIDEFDVEYLNLKEDTIAVEGEGNKENYEKIADIIKKNDLTLVVTETTTQLSNQKFYGYDYIFGEVVKSGKASKVIRAFETYDDSQADSSKYKHRTNQHFNSTIDRNARFIVVGQITVGNTSYKDLADLTFKATEEYVQKVKDEGFSVNGKTQPLNYVVDKGMNYALCACAMIMAVMIMLRAAFNKTFPKLTFISVLLCIIAFAVTLYMPARFVALLALYPTVFSAIMSCFAMTMLLLFLKNFKDKFPTIMLSAFSLVIVMICLLCGSIAMGSMLSGIDYYINNDIFRGIKISLLVPVAYTAVLYYLMFIRTEKSKLLLDIKKVLCANIKVYWLLLGGVVAFIGIYYILRSGNVESISEGEAAMRNTLTEMFSARPRTKEFLIGYPALILLCYYIKNHQIPLISWLLAIASSILAASVTNSFCHVFTDYMTIVERTFNGLIVGLIVSAVIITGNMFVVRIARKIGKKLSSEDK